MPSLTAHTYVCPDCRQRVEVKITAELIYCARCRQTMILAKGQPEALFEIPENNRLQKT